MSAIPNQKRRGHLKGLIAGIAGAGLLAGGSTFALWSASDKIGGATIIAGNLDIKAIQTAFYDVSPDRRDVAAIPNTNLTGHAIDDLATYRVVPGDEIAGVYDVALTLEGDNLVAKLTIDVDDFSSTNMAMQYDLYYSGASLLKQPVSLAPGQTEIGLFQASGVGQSGGTNDNVPVIDLPASANAANVKVVVYGTFNDVTGRDQAAAQTVIGDISLKLEQVRQGTDLFA